VWAIVPDGGGGWFVGGDFTCVDRVAAHGLVHLSSTGKLDEGWRAAPGVAADVVRLARRGGRLYVGRSRSVAALDARTGASLWTDRIKGPGDPTAVAADAHAVYVGGRFTRIAGRPAHGLVALAPRTGRVLSWHAPVADLAIVALEVDGRDLWVGGVFSSLGGRARDGIARVDAATGNVEDWRPRGPVGVVEALAVAGGEVVAGGHDTFVALDVRTGRSLVWARHVDGEADVFAAAGRTIYFGGGCRAAFTEVGGKHRPNLAAVLPGGRLSGWVPAIRRNQGIDALAATRERVLVAIGPCA
jgi:outer membrane protein assembly factor BamB